MTVTRKDYNFNGESEPGIYQQNEDLAASDSP